MRFNTFDEVAKWYDNTKPIISKNHNKEDDVRPLGQRRYKWMRIIKVDDNTYALTDGSWSEMSYNGSNPKEREYNRMTAPILWERREDGEYVSVRGCMGNGYSISRYDFYWRYLPQKLGHVSNTRQGKHWIDNFSTGERHILPKMGYRYDYQAKGIVDYEDRSLVFKRDGDNFVRVGEVQVKSTHIDREAKKQVKPLIENFYQWMQAIAPMVASGYSARHDYAKVMEEHGIVQSAWLALRFDLYGNKVREILEQDDHPCRVALASLILNRLEYTTTAPTTHAGSQKRVPDQTVAHGYRWEWVEGRPYTEEETAAWYIKEAKRIKTGYNRLMNKALDLFKTETV